MDTSAGESAVPDQAAERVRGFCLHFLNILQFCGGEQRTAFFSSGVRGGTIRKMLPDFIKFQYSKCFLVHNSIPVLLF